MSTQPDATALSISGLRKSYGELQVLDDLELELARGAIHGLVGLNGSGKTTTLECTLGLQAYDGGNISLLGSPPSDLHRQRGRVVGIFDTPSLNPHLTVRQCLQQAYLLCAQPVRSIEEAEQLLGIERFSDFRVRQLSLGNKRRAAIAHALLGNPELILLDEPFNGLDAGGVDDVLALIRRLNREFGTSFLLSSHQLPYLEQVCSHIAILHRGQIVLSDAIDTLLAKTESRALLRTTAGESLRRLIQTQTPCRLAGPDADGLYEIQLADMDSAQLNRLLVSQDIPVQELRLERASLERLFREVTREAAA